MGEGSVTLQELALARNAARRKVVDWVRANPNRMVRCAPDYDEYHGLDIAFIRKCIEEGVNPAITDD